MMKKFAAFFVGLILLGMSVYAQTYGIGENPLEKFLFYDNMRNSIEDDWRFYMSGDATYTITEHEEKGVISLTKGIKQGWTSPRMELKSDIGKEYVITADVKIDNNPDGGTIKSFEYVNFEFTGGADKYILEWFYSSNTLKLLKNNKAVKEVSLSKLNNYKKFGWNRYSFEVADGCVRVYINGAEAMFLEDSNLVNNKGAFAIYGATTYPQNVNIFVDSVVVTEPHSEKVIFYDDFTGIKTLSWRFGWSGNGEGKIEQLDGNSVIAIKKYDQAIISAPKATLVENIGNSYYATAKIKVEKSNIAQSIRSFEYMKVEFTSGKSVYRLDWTYSVSQLRLYKNNKLILEKDAAYFPGYSQFDWNKYGFEVTDSSVRIFINDREFMKYGDKDLVENKGKFEITGLTTYAKNVNLYIDDVSITKIPIDKVWIDSKNYVCKMTSDGKVRIECRVYGPKERDITNGTLIGAIYQDGILKGSAVQKISIPAGALSDTAALEIEAEDLFHEFDLKLMLWDDGNLIPISNGIESKTGYFIEDFDVVQSGELVYDTDFSEELPQFITPDTNYEAGGFRKDTIGGNDVLYLYGGYGKKGEERSFKALLPEIFNGYVMDVTLSAHRFLSDTASVILNYQNDDSYYAFTWTRGGFPDIYSEYPVQKFRLCKNGMTDIINPRYEEIPNKNVPFSPCGYRIYVFPERILIYRKDDGTPLFSYKPQTPIPPGQIGFMSGGTGNGNMKFYVDDLKIWVL